jgi:phage terminase small subunit
MGEVMTDRAEVLRRLLANGNDPDVAQLYADAFCEYHEAQENISRNGAVCANPRTGAPLENPYLKVRDKARAQLVRLRSVRSAGLW